MPFYIITGLMGFAVIAISCELFRNAIDCGKIRFKISGIYGKLVSAAGIALPSLIIPFASVIAIPGERGQEISGAALIGALLFVAAAAPAIIAYAAGSAADKRQYDGKADEKFLRRSLEFFAAAVLCGLVFSLFPMPVKKSLAFLFLGAYIFYTLKTAGKHREEQAEPPAGLYFSRKKLPEGRLVLLQGAVSILGMAAGAVFYVSGVSHAIPAAGARVFVFSLIVSPLVVVIPAVAAGIVSLKRKNEIQALALFAKFMVFQATAVVFAGIAVTDWIFGTQAVLAVLAAFVSAASAAALIRIRKRVSAYMFLPGAVLYVLCLLALMLWVK